MENLSEAPPPPITPKRVYVPSLHQEATPIQFEGNVNLESSLQVLNCGRRQQEKLVQSMSGKVNCLVNKDLPQKSFEGVGDEEWVSIQLFVANYSVLTFVPLQDDDE